MWLPVRLMWDKCEEPATLLPIDLRKHAGLTSTEQMLSLGSLSWALSWVSPPAPLGFEGGGTFTRLSNKPRSLGVFKNSICGACRWLVS